MKGVILGIAPNTQVVDITHGIPSYDLVEAAFSVASAYRYFPKGTVHVVVVDPGVGSERRPLAAESDGHFFVGPDNGVLSAVLESKVHHVTNSKLFINPVSRTFHGRDIFAPVAAHLARGASLDTVGPAVTDFIATPLPKPSSMNGKVLAAVLRIDKFGNIITNLRSTHLGRGFVIRLGGVAVTRLCASYFEGRPSEFFALEGSTGFIEISIHQGSAADRLHVTPGAEIEVESGSPNH